MPPDEPPGAPRPRPRPGRARRAAEPLAWWTALLAVYLALVSTISLTEITLGALTAAAGAAAAVAARRALLITGTTRAAGGADRPAAAGRLLPPLARLPAQIVADTARITLRGASGGDWTALACPPGPAGRGAATLLMSTSPGTYVGGTDPERALLRVHRLTGPSPFERSLRRAGLVGDPARPAGRHRAGPP
ncbi:hypothetical protein [Actinomadura coerulea]|uniref:hypothetical protein n=1 Tax=Actinomadura coerulea TaxID=46159 RepID=UPI003420CE14